VTAAENGNVPLFRFLLSHPDIDLSKVSHGQWTVLDWAVQSGDPAALRLVFECPKFVRKEQLCGVKWIKSVFAGGNPWLVKELLALNVVGIESRDQAEAGPLHWAAHAGAIAVLRLLLENEGIDVNARDREGKTALHHAVANGMFDAVRLLADTPGVDLDAEDNDGVFFGFRIPQWDGHSIGGI
jgi:ankyrin repeat protein